MLVPLALLLYKQIKMEKYKKLNLATGLTGLTGVSAAVDLAAVVKKVSRRLSIRIGGGGATGAAGVGEGSIASATSVNPMIPKPPTSLELGVELGAVTDGRPDGQATRTQARTQTPFFSPRSQTDSDPDSSALATTQSIQRESVGVQLTDMRPAASTGSEPPISVGAAVLSLLKP